MRLTYRQIGYLREVARHNSITSACKDLCISQSSVLAAINVAEEATGVRLFNRRKGHGIELTPAGQKFLFSAQRFLAAGADFDRSIDEFSQAATTTVRIGCFSPFGALLIPPVLRRYVEANGKCEIVLLEGDQIQLRNWLVNGDVDLIVTYDIGQEFDAGITPICKCPAHALLRRGDPIAKQASISMRELAKQPLILLDLPETGTYLMALFDISATRPTIGLKTTSYDTVRSAVSNGLGVSVLNIRPRPHASPDSDDLIRLPISDKLRQPTVLVADPYGDQKPAYVRSFIHILYQYIVDIGPDNFAVVIPKYARGLVYPKPVCSNPHEDQ